MAYADIIRTVSATMENVANLIEGVLTAAANLVFTTWSPTLTTSGSMTYTSSTITFARYFQIGKFVLFKVAFTGTVGGTPSTYIGFTLPVTSDGAGISAAVSILDASSLIGGFTSSGSSTRLDIYRYNNVVFTAGTVSFNCYGFYEAA